MTLADEARDAVDELYDLDVTLEQREQCPSVAFVRRVLAGGEADVRGGAREPLPALGAESCEVRDPLDLFGRDHSTRRYCVSRTTPNRAQTKSPFRPTSSRLSSI